MRRLTLDGVAPSEAARIALTSPGPVLVADANAAGDTETSADVDVTPHLSEQAFVDEPDADVVVSVQSAARSGGRVLATPGASPAVRGLARAAMALDAEAISRIIARSLEDDGVVGTWEKLLHPVLVAAGRRWELTGEGVDVEHLLSESATGALRSAAARMRVVGRRPVLLACGPGDQHSLPLYAVAAGLAERGTPSRVLGAAVPRDALRSAITRLGPSAVLVWAQMRLSADTRTIDQIPVTRPPTMIVLAGPGWHGVPLPSRANLVQSLPEAIERLVGLG